MPTSFPINFMKSVTLFPWPAPGKRASKRNIPWLTLILSLFSVPLLELNDALMLLCFDRLAVSQGEWWRLITGHLVHSSFDHWLWDTLAFFCVGVYLELRSRKCLFITLLLGLATVNTLLLSSWSPLFYYCGLSGVLFAPLTLALWYHWQNNRGLIGITPLIICVGKVVWECSLHSSLLVTSGWPAYPQSHLAGILGGVIASIIFSGCSTKPKTSC